MPSNKGFTIFFALSRLVRDGRFWSDKSIISWFGFVGIVSFGGRNNSTDFDSYEHIEINNDDNNNNDDSNNDVNGHTYINNQTIHV